MWISKCPSFELQLHLILYANSLTRKDTLSFFKHVSLEPHIWRFQPSSPSDANVFCPWQLVTKVNNFDKYALKLTYLPKTLLQMVMLAFHKGNADIKSPYEVKSMKISVFFAKNVDIFLQWKFLLLSWVTWHCDS